MHSPKLIKGSYPNYIDLLQAVLIRLAAGVSPCLRKMRRAVQFWNRNIGLESQKLKQYKKMMTYCEVISYNQEKLNLILN